MTTEPSESGDAEHRFGHPGPSWTGGRDDDDEQPATDGVDWPEGEGPAGLPLASFWWRVAGFAVDNLVVVLVLVVFNVILGTRPASSLSDGETMVVSLINILFQVAYWWFWNSLGWSPGKRVVGLRIVDDQGEPPGAERGFRRTVISLLSGMLLFAGYLWALWDGRNQTWHDKLAGTFVVVAPRDESRTGAGPQQPSG